MNEFNGVRKGSPRGRLGGDLAGSYDVMRSSRERGPSGEILGEEGRGVGKPRGARGEGCLATNKGRNRQKGGYFIKNRTDESSWPTSGRMRPWRG